MSFTRFVRDMPIERKLTFVMLQTAALALLLTSAAVISYELFRYQRSVVRDITAQAQIIAANSAAALAFDDEPAARETLDALKVRREILLACLYSPEGKIFAQTTRGSNTPPRLSANEPEGIRFDAGYLASLTPVNFGRDRVGTLLLHVSLREQRLRLQTYASIVIAVTLAALLASMLLARRLRRFIAGPIVELTRVTRGVTERQDYSLRAAGESHDEIGLLVDGFNQMLEQIQNRDARLTASEQRFRQVTESIREVFWMTDVAKSQMIYISPGYEQIWGREREELLRDATQWLEAVHPEDRERVRQAALTRQAGGSYDEEYRIIKPDGDVRWIRDRAFPVTDADGHVYRVVGVADDITERKRLEKQILEISDREQARIGQDLHDGLCQHLVSTAFAANLLEKKLAAANVPESERAGQIVALLDEAITEARQLARGLYPVKLETEGLNSALVELAAAVRTRSGLECAVDLPDGLRFHDPAVATHLYRIAQEAVANAVRHSQARQILIRFECAERHCRLTVADDGVGLARNGAAGDGMGTHIIRYRARLLGGTLEFQSSPHGGTTVCCACPRTIIEE